MHRLNKVILIICEGEGTESPYFESIRDILIDRDSDIKIHIVPKSKNEEQREIQVRQGLKKRELKILDAVKELELKGYEVEDIYKAQPVRYVREAQMGLEDGSCDEAWAVFDKDQHPKHKEAFELSRKEVNNTKVNIAFSSISFEHWVLLHFEINQMAFIKSQCREGDRGLNCGWNTDPHDCNGVKCVCGYLIAKKYFTNPLTKKRFLFNRLPNYSFAINNAIALNKAMNIKYPEIPVYDLNPYNTLYRLVFKLLSIPIDFIWFDKNAEAMSDLIAFRIELIGNNVHIEIRSLKSHRVILNEGSFALIDSLGQINFFGERKVFEDNFKIEFDVASVDNFFPVFIGYRQAENVYLITDL